MLNKISVEEIIRRAILEDISGIDNTNDYLIGAEEESIASLSFKQRGILSGSDVFKWVFEMLDSEVRVEFNRHDGEVVEHGEQVAELRGKALSILKGERVALNFLQRMSGIATLSNQYASMVEGMGVRVVDTRKTTPGLRLLEKYAVKTGGCYNHRYNLSDAIMIKDNHIRAVGSIGEAVKRARRDAPHTIRIEVEVETFEQLDEAIDSKADIIMLDNMSIGDMEKAVAIIGGRAIVEASGNVSLENIVEIAGTGVDVISVGALTHSAKSADISLNII